MLKLKDKVYPISIIEWEGRHLGDRKYPYVGYPLNLAIA